MVSCFGGGAWTDWYITDAMQRSAILKCHHLVLPWKIATYNYYSEVSYYFFLFSRLNLSIFLSHLKSQHCKFYFWYQSLVVACIPIENKDTNPKIHIQNLQEPLPDGSLWRCKSSLRNRTLVKNFADEVQAGIEFNLFFCGYKFSSVLTTGKK